MYTKAPEPLSRKSDGSPGPEQALLSPSQALRPQNLREDAALEEGGMRGARSGGITHRRSAVCSRGPAPTGPAWRAACEDLKSLLIAGAASASPPLSSDAQTSSRAVRPLTPKQVGRFSPPLLEGGGRETRTHQSCRTTHPL